MNSTGKTLALLATARVANIPSVASNVSLGVALAVLASREWQASLVPAWLGLTLSGVLLYISGNFFNDWMDRDWDAKHRPERALPSGLFRPGHYLAAAIAAAIAAITLAWWIAPAAGTAAVAILVSIAIYTKWHKSAAWAVLPMGFCRAGLVFLGAWGMAGSFGSSGFILFLTPHALALLIYIAGLSLSARYESRSDPPASALLTSRALLIASGLLMAASWVAPAPLPALIGLLAFAGWLGLCLGRYRRPVPVHVSALLAGIPLLDWIALLPLAVAAQAAAAPPSFVTACAVLPPLAMITGRALQRVASAT